MNCFCTSNGVLSSPINGQLQDALPGESIDCLSVAVGFSARSVPNVDSTTAFKLPITMNRHGVSHGVMDSGFTGPLPMRSSGSGNDTRYSVSCHCERRRVPQ